MPGQGQGTGAGPGPVQVEFGLGRRSAIYPAVDMPPSTAPNNSPTWCFRPSFETCRQPQLFRIMELKFRQFYSTSSSFHFNASTPYQTLLGRFNQSCTGYGVWGTGYGAGYGVIQSERDFSLRNAPVLRLTPDQRIDIGRRPG